MMKRIERTKALRIWFPKKDVSDFVREFPAHVGEQYCKREAYFLQCYHGDNVPADSPPPMLRDSQKFTSVNL